jgi:hypothetical protein
VKKRFEAPVRLSFSARSASSSSASRRLVMSSICMTTRAADAVADPSAARAAAVSRPQKRSPVAVRTIRSTAVVTPSSPTSALHHCSHGSPPSQATSWVTSIRVSSCSRQPVIAASAWLTTSTPPSASSSAPPIGDCSKATRHCSSEAASWVVAARSWVMSRAVMRTGVPGLVQQLLGGGVHPQRPDR